MSTAGMDDFAVSAGASKHDSKKQNESREVGKVQLTVGVCLAGSVRTPPGKPVASWLPAERLHCFHGGVVGWDCKS